MQKLVADSIKLSSWRTASSFEPIRLSEKPPALRGADWAARYDATTIFFDVFWDARNEAIIAIGPPPLNLERELAIEAFAWPSGERIAIEKSAHYLGVKYVFRSPVPMAALRLVSAVGEVVLAPQPNLSGYFAGARAIVTQQQNESLTAIADWLRFYARYHGANAVVIYNNKSDRYERDDIIDCIRANGGYSQYAVIDWDFRFGPADYWHPYGLRTHDDFTQTGALEHARLRLLGAASGLISADIDEFVLCRNQESIFDLLDRSRTGYLVYPGVWVEAALAPERVGAAGELRHKDFTSVLADARPYAGDDKWAVAPNRCATASEPVWFIHRVIGALRDGLSDSVVYRHFKGINRDWHYQVIHQSRKRHDLAVVDPARHRIDQELKAALDRIFPDGESETSSRAAGIDRAAAALRLRLRAELHRRHDGDLERALAFARQAASAKSDQPDLLDYVGDILDAGSAVEEAKAAHEGAERLRAGNPWYHVMQGRYRYICQQDYAGAAACFERAIALDPKFAPAYVGLVLALCCSLAPAGAIVACCERGLHHCPDEPELLHNLGWTHFWQGDLNAAQIAADKFSALAPDAAEPLILGSEIALRRGDLDGAERAAREALARGVRTIAQWRTIPRNASRRRAFGLDYDDRFTHPFPESSMLSSLYEQLGKVLVRRNELEQARAAFEQALAVAPPQASVLRGLAEIDQHLGDHAGSRALIDKALQCARNDYERSLTSHRGVRQSDQNIKASASAFAECLIAADRCEEALAVAEKWRERFSDMGVHAARALKQLKRPREALASLRQALPHEDMRPWHFHLLADLLEDNGDDKEAESAWRRAIEGDPAQNWVHFRLAENLQRQGDRAGALAAWRKAASFEPDKAWIWLRIADNCEQIGDPAEAERAWCRAIELDAEQAWPWQRLAALRQGTGDDAGALLAWRRAAALMPGHAWLQHRVADLTEKCGDHQEAAVAWQRSAALEPHQAWIWHRLANVLEKSGALAQSLEVWRHAATLDPDKAWIGQRMDELQAKISSGARPGNNP